MLTINIIGCGKLGQTLGKLFCLKKVAAIKNVVNTSLLSGEKAVIFIGQGVATSLEQLAAADIYLITTPDDVIQKTCNQLASKKKLQPQTLVMHCSGSLSSDVLLSAKNEGCLVASVHPVKSFADPSFAVKSFNSTFCAYEGDEAALSIITPLFASIGGNIFTLKKENKNLYHASLSMANNYLVTLHYHAMQSLILSGIEEDTAKILASQMVSEASQHLQHLDHQTALTGPIQRGDLSVVTRHLEVLDQTLISKNIYSALGMGTLPLTTHSQEIKEKFITLFTEY